MRVGRGKRIGLLSALAVAAIAGTPSTAFAAECDPIMPVSEVTSGMTGTGLSVVRGRTPEPFAIEVLGVLKNEIGPGRDMIIVEASSATIDSAGIWFGMSGSPVYVGGRLIGAIAFGFSGSAPIAGLTPASDMAKVLAYPTLAPRTMGGSAYLPPAVRLPASMRERIAEATGTEAGAVPSTMTRLRVPLSVSGLRARGLERVQAWAEKKKLGFIPYSGSSASRTAVAPTTLQPGDNFAAALSYGDVTAAGVGTTTYVCNGRALAFGHPFLFNGATRTGANAADALTVITDPVWGSFKMATIAETVGGVDQDRLAAIRAVLGAAPQAVPIRTTVTARDLNTSRAGATDIVLEDETPFITFLHLLSNIDSTYDAIDKGSSELSWTITGKREDGTPWSFSRSNIYADPFDIAIASSDEVASELDLISFNPFEDVDFTGVRVEAGIEEAVRQYTLTRLLVARKSGPFRAKQSIKVRPGELLRFRAVLKPFERGTDWTFEFNVRVPRRASQTMGMVEVSGAPGGPPRICFSEAECEGGTVIKSFDGLLRALEQHPKNNVLGSSYRVGERMRLKSKRNWELNGVVRGFKMVFLIPPGGEGPRGDEPKPPPGVEEGSIGGG
jgi:hypothetical protein